ncbi:MAG: RasGEF domain [Chlamydiales bacterium]|jgi:hypothetical protein|nr:RasGEF domain [Chlamydiales bacterium]
MFPTDRPAPQKSPPLTPIEERSRLLPSRRGLQRFFSLQRKKKEPLSAGGLASSAPEELETIEKVEQAVNDVRLNLERTGSDDQVKTRLDEARIKVRPQRSLSLSSEPTRFYVRKAPTLNDIYRMPNRSSPEIKSLIMALGQGTLAEQLEQVKDLGLTEYPGIERLLSWENMPPLELSPDKVPPDWLILMPQSLHAQVLYRATLAGIPALMDTSAFFELMQHALASDRLPAKNKWALLKSALEWVLLPRQEGVTELSRRLSQIAKMGIEGGWGVFEGWWLLDALSRIAKEERERQEKREILFERETLLASENASLPLGRIKEQSERQALNLAVQIKNLMAHLVDAILPSELLSQPFGPNIAQSAEFFNALPQFFLYQIISSHDLEDAAHTIYFIRLVQEHLLELADFNSLLAIECLFSDDRIRSVLKKCQETLKKNKKYEPLQKKFEKMLYSIPNFGPIRQYMSHLMPRPMIPILLLYTKSITGAREMKDTDEEHSKFNLAKMRAMGMVLLQLQTLQRAISPSQAADRQLWQAILPFNAQKNPKLKELISAFCKDFATSTPSN